MDSEQQGRKEETEKIAVSIVGVSVGLILVMCIVMTLIRLV